MCKQLAIQVTNSSHSQKTNSIKFDDYKYNNGDARIQYTNGFVIFSCRISEVISVAKGEFSICDGLSILTNCIDG